MKRYPVIVSKGQLLYRSPDCNKTVAVLALHALVILAFIPLSNFIPKIEQNQKELKPATPTPVKVVEEAKITSVSR
ncbi:MAG: hypothetical protein ACI8R6_000074 [Candidatus Paceibacteria bacterium]|jgi:hypothetical protein